MPTTRFGRETSKIFTTGGTGRHGETLFTTRAAGARETSFTTRVFGTWRKTLTNCESSDCVS